MQLRASEAYEDIFEDKGAFYLKLGGCKHGKCVKAEFYHQLETDLNVIKIGFGGGAGVNRVVDFGFAQNIPREGKSVALTFGADIGKGQTFGANGTVEFYEEHDYEVSLEGTYRSFNLGNNFTSNEMNYGVTLSRGYDLGSTMLYETFYLK